MRILLVLLASAASCGGEDAGPIEFEDLRVEEIASDRAVARFRTSVPTECEIEYGIEVGTTDQTARDPEMEEGERVAVHQVPLEDLDAETTYYWRARATNADGDTAYSEPQTFVTLFADDPTAAMVNVAAATEGTSILDVSSNWGGSNSGSFGASSLIDGSMASEWSSAGDGDDAYVVVNLGRSRTLEFVGYRSRQMSDGTSIVTSIELYIGDATYGPFPTPNPDQRFVFALNPPVEAQQVRLDVVTSTGGNTGGRELQLY